VTTPGVVGARARWRRVPLPARALLTAAVYALAYLVTAKTQPPQFVGVTAFWLPNAAVLVPLLWSRRRDWAAYLPPVVAADVLSGHYLWGTGLLDPLAAAVAACNFGESALAAALLLRVVGLPRMDRTRDVVAFVGLAGLVAPAVNTVVVWSLVEAVREAPPQFAQHFFIGDMTGMLVLAPALLAWSAGPRWRRPGTDRLVEGGAVAVVLAVVTAAVFWPPAGGQPLMSPYLLVPVLVWVAVRLGPRAVTATVLVIAATTTTATALNRGPFASTALTPVERVAALQLFVVSAVLAALVLAAVQATSRRQQVELDSTEARFRTGFLVSPIGLAFSDLGGRLLEVNAAFCELVGRNENELLGMRFLDLTHPEDVDGDAAALHRLGAGDERAYRAEKRYVRPDGAIVWANVTVATLPDDAGDPTRFFAQVVDVTARREAEGVLARQATHDALTGLPNRRLFLELLRAALRRLGREPGTVAVLFVDVDRFKQVNDLHGHAAGDDLLMRIGHLLADTVRPSDVTARHGGDEFTVLLDHLADEGEAAVIADRILTALRAGTPGPPLDVSIGVAATTDPALPPETLVAHADAAMYRAKSRGGGRWQMFDEVTYTTLLRRARTAEDLQDALGAGQLSVDYQPIVRMSDGTVTGVEALLRWTHPTRGRLDAAEFVDVLEHSPALSRITRWMVHRACTDLSGWQRDPSLVAPEHVHVNIVPRQLIADDLVGLLESAAVRVGLRPGSLCVEVTESAMADLEQADEALRRLRESGCLVALDDFGIGHSSLSRLAEWPVDQIKVDKSLVQQVTTPRGVALVTAAKGIAETLGCEIVCEGVESTGQRDALTGLGLDLAQGFLFSTPVPAGSVAPLLRPSGSLRRSNGG
jgi:diguanylate cyclase (GGDEF)-like protein/PAS domain S-box-containing protein